MFLQPFFSNSHFVVRPYKVSIVVSVYKKCFKFIILEKYWACIEKHRNIFSLINTKSSFLRDYNDLCTVKTMNFWYNEEIVK